MQNHREGKRFINGWPFWNATITLFDKSTGKTLNGTTTNNAGQFTLTDISVGSYKILIDCKPREINNFFIKKGETVDIKTVILNFTWKFGLLKFKKEREKGNNANAAP